MKSSNNMIYIPERIAKEVSVILQQPLTLITAGAGYGKTTAIVDCLKHVPRNISYRWYTCFGEPPERAWDGICNLIAFVDTRVGEYLSKLEFPSVDHLGQIAAFMEEIVCEKETVLLIDNFQMTGFSSPFHLLNALSVHGCDKLHIVVMSHPLYTELGLSMTDPRIYQIQQDLFCFTPADVTRLFSLNDAIITEEQAIRLCHVTEGWVAAIRLHLSTFLTDGKLAENVGMRELMEHSFWKTLDERQQGLFLSLSLLDTFTELQAARMIGRDIIPEELWTLVCGNAFVKNMGKEYTFHSLLKSFLRAKLATRPDVYKRKLYSRAGEACQAQGKNVDAVLFFIDAVEFVGALSVPLNSLQLVELVRTKTAQMEILLSNCHTEILEGRCQFLLSIASQASLNRKMQLARIAILRLKQLRDLGGQTELGRRAEAALEVTASFGAYNDITEMSRHHVAAISLLDDPEDFDVTNNSWSFCIPSVVYMFWRGSGELENTTELLKKSIPNYALLADGKGLGGPEIMEAEAELLQGQIANCISKGYLARTIAQKAGQDSISFCVHTLFARAAIFRDNATAFLNSILAIKSLAFEGKEFLCVTSAEVATGFLYSILDMEDNIPDWMFSIENVRETLYPISVPFAFIITLRYIRKHIPEGLLGTAEAFIRETDEHHHLLPKIYFLLEVATWYEQNNKREKSIEYTELALSLALPDKVYIPFAEYYAELSGVFNDELLSGINLDELKMLHTLGRQFVNGANKIRAFISGVSPLTQREREIALLAQKRVSTKEIAQMLCISPATVKNTLNKIYSKLNINGKKELIDRQI